MATEDGEEECFPFLNLPPELMLRVCDYIDSTTVVNVLGQVCVYLHQLVNEDWIWRTRIRNRWPHKRYPPATIVAGFCWKKACMSRESEYSKWKSPETRLNGTELAVSYACVDAVHINAQHDLLLVGTRDHRLTAYRLKDIPRSEKCDSSQLKSVEAFHHDEAHKGWVWTVNSSNDIICTGGWDSKLSLWNITGEPLSSYKCQSPVICTAIEDNDILAGTMQKRLIKVDPRVPTPTAIKEVGGKAVLCMQMTSRWLITGHVSRTIHIFDRHSLVTCNVAKCPTGYPKCMCLLDNLLYVGCQDGSLNLYEFDHQLGKLTFIETLQKSDERRMEVRSVQATLGSVITANKDGSCKVWEPSGSPAQLSQLSLGAEICDMVYVDDNLVAGLNTGCVSLYRPTISDAQT